MRSVLGLVVLLSLTGCGEESRPRVVTVPKTENREPLSGKVPAATAAPRAIATH